MDERQDSRALADPLSGLEQDLQSKGFIALGRPDPNLATHSCSDRDVLPYVGGSVDCQPGPLLCTVAGRLHYYTCHRADPRQFSDSDRCCRQQYLLVNGYCGGYSGHAGIPDYLQSRNVFRQSETLEMVASRALGPEQPVHDLYEQRKEHSHRSTRFYSCGGPGQGESLLCVVGQYPVELGMSGCSIPEAACNRGDLDRKTGLRSYAKFNYRESYRSLTHLAPESFRIALALEKAKADQEAPY